MTASSDPLDTELAPGFTVRHYEKARAMMDRTAIAGAIRQRFAVRYILPVSSDGPTKSGFAIMAVSCLMIEALESFRQGWDSSEGRSKAAFCFFFDAEKAFKDFRGHAQDFYKHVRCGILHQAETTGGWRIRREGSLFDAGELEVNATVFMKRLERVLSEFCEKLKAIPWDDPRWEKVRTKMDAIAKHCRK